MNNSGILRVKNDSEPSPPPIIEVPMAYVWFMM